MNHRNIEVKNKIQPDKVIKVVPFRKDIRVTRPHKHNSYFELIFLTRGSGTHYIDMIGYEVCSGSVYVINHEQTHHWNLVSEPEVFVILFKKAFIEQSIDKELKSLIFQLSMRNYLRVSNYDMINELFKLLVDEVASTMYAVNTIIEGLIKALFSKVLQQSEETEGIGYRGAGLCYDFIRLLSSGYGLRNHVRYYAEQLNTTPQNLNQICKKELGSTASKVLADYIMIEAKRLLSYTDLNVSEVGLHLSFNDASHFIKYFKRFAGVTPQMYRAELK